MSANEIRVAVIEPVGQYGGMDGYDIAFLTALLQAGVDAVLYTSWVGQPLEELDGRVIGAFNGVFGKSPKWVRGLKYVSASLKVVLRMIMERRRICHVHVFHAGILELFQISLFKLFLRKVVLTVHDVQSLDGRKDFKRLVYKLADSLVVHSDVARTELAQRLQMPVGDISHVPHGASVLPQNITPGAARASLGLHPHDQVLLFFGQIKDAKGLDLLIAALPGVIEKHPNAMLLIAGRPWQTDFSRYYEQIQTLNLGRRCTLHIRFIEAELVPTYYQAADLVVLPYRSIYQSGVLLNAMSYGRPVLVSNIPGMTEVIKHGFNGFVFEALNSDSLGRALVSALAEPTRLREVAVQATRTIRDNHDWGRVGQKSKVIYARLSPDVR